MEILNVLVNKFDNWECSIMEIAKNIHKAFEVIFSSRCLHMNHSIRGKKRVTIESIYSLLGLMLSILIENFCCKSKIYKCISLCFWVVTDILKLQIAMSVAKFMNNL